MCKSNSLAKFLKFSIALSLDLGNEPLCQISYLLNTALKYMRILSSEFIWQQKRLFLTWHCSMHPTKLSQHPNTDCYRILLNLGFTIAAKVQ